VVTTSCGGTLILPEWEVLGKYGSSIKPSAGIGIWTLTLAGLSPRRHDQPLSVALTWLQLDLPGPPTREASGDQGEHHRR